MTAVGDNLNVTIGHARVLHFDVDPDVVQREHQYLRMRVLGPAGPHTQGASTAATAAASGDIPRIFNSNLRDSVDTPLSVLDGDEDDIRSHFGGPRALKVLVGNTQTTCEWSVCDPLN
jgi:hypothetical protein